MFKKLGGGLKTLGKGKKEKLRVDLEVIDISGLPPPIRECRVMWITQKGMVQLTPSKVVRAGTARFRGQTMTHITSMGRNKEGDCRIKEFVLKLQAPSAGDRMATFCKAPLDLSKYVSNTPEPSTQSDVIPLQFKVGTPTTGYLKFNVTCTVLGEVAEDGMTEMSGLTSEADQDLDGFEMPPSPTGSMRSVQTSVSGREPSTAGKHEKKGSFQSKFMSRISSLGKDSFSSSKGAREGSRASTDGAGRSHRASDSGSGITEPSRPAPDFGKKTGSTTGQSGRPPEYKPPTPSDFSKKTASSSPAGAFGMGALGKPPRPSADPYAEEYDAPKPLPIERPKTQTRKGLMGFMQEREDDSEEETLPPPPKPPTSSTQPPGSSSNSSNTLNPFHPPTPPPAPTSKQDHPNPFRASGASATSPAGSGNHVPPPTKPEDANPFRASGTSATPPAGPDHVTPPASSSATPGVGKPGAPSSQPGPSASLSSEARGPAGPNGTSGAAGTAALTGVTAKERQLQPDRSSKKPAAPLAWRGSKAEAKIPLPSLNTTPSPPTPTPPSVKSTLSDKNGTAPIVAAPSLTAASSTATANELDEGASGSVPSPSATTATRADTTAGRGTSPELEVGASGSVPSPTATTATRADTTAGRAASATPSAPSGVVETGTPISTDPGLSRTTSLSQPASGAPPVPPATAAAAAAAAATTTPRASSPSPPRSRAGVAVDPANAVRRDSSVGARAKLESASSMQTTIVRHDSQSSSLSSSGVDEEALERGTVPDMPGIRTTERRRMQSLESHPEVDLPESQQQGDEAGGEEKEEKEEEEQQVEEDEHQRQQHIQQKGPPAGGGEDASEKGAADERSRDLQAMCAKLEQQAEAERLAGAKARQQLEAAQREIQTLRAEQDLLQAAFRQQQQQQQQQQAQPELPGEVGELHRRVQEAEMIAAGIKRSNEALTQELEGTKQACARLENLVCEGLNGWNHDQALEAVSCFQDKYEQLHARYQQMEADFMEEADSLVAQLLDAMQQVDELSACMPEGVAEAAHNPDRPRTQYIEAPHAHALRIENEALVEQLVSRQLELAGALEEKAKLRRDLYRTKEVNLKVANKLTNLQAQVYAYESGYDPES